MTMNGEIGYNNVSADTMNNSNGPGYLIRDHVEIDPEFRDLLPELSDEEYRRLKEDMRENGYNADENGKLVIWHESEEYVLVEGHHRWKACHELYGETGDDKYLPGNECFVEKEFTNRSQVKVWIIRHQMSRRNLSSYAAFEVFYENMDDLKAQARQNRMSGLQQNTVLANLPERKINVRDELALMLNVGSRTVGKFIRVADSANEEVKRELRLGNISADAAYKRVTSGAEKPNETIGVGKAVCTDTDLMAGMSPAAESGDHAGHDWSPCQNESVSRDGNHSVTEDDTSISHYEDDASSSDEPDARPAGHETEAPEEPCPADSATVWESGDEDQYPFSNGFGVIPSFAESDESSPTDMVMVSRKEYEMLTVSLLGTENEIANLQSDNDILEAENHIMSLVLERHDLMNEFEQTKVEEWVYGAVYASDFPGKAAGTDEISAKEEAVVAERDVPETAGETDEALVATEVEETMADNKKEVVFEEPDVPGKANEAGEVMADNKTDETVAPTKTISVEELLENLLSEEPAEPAGAMVSTAPATSAMVFDPIIFDTVEDLQRQISEFRCSTIPEVDKYIVRECWRLKHEDNITVGTLREVLDNARLMEFMPTTA